jgi:hypothetical protein
MAVASRSEQQITVRALERIQRTNLGALSARPRSWKRPAVGEPWRVTTKGLPQNAATTAPASQFT